MLAGMGGGNIITQCGVIEAKNTRDRRVSNVLTPRASECKRIRENQFHTTITIGKAIKCDRGQ